MTTKEIKEILEENLLKDIKTVEKADEYIDMFNKANELLEEHKKLIQISPFLNFTKEVAKYLESKGYKYDIADDNHIIEHNCHSLGLGKYVFLQADYNEKSSTIKYHFGLCYVKEKIKKLKNTIESIFDFEYHENKEEWIFDYNQNIIENYNPKKIAEVMIKLYELIR